MVTHKEDFEASIEKTIRHRERRLSYTIEKAIGHK